MENVLSFIHKSPWIRNVFPFQVSSIRQPVPSPLLGSFLRAGSTRQKDKLWHKPGSDRATSAAAGQAVSPPLWMSTAAHCRITQNASRRAGKGQESPQSRSPLSREAPGCKAGVSLPSSASGAKVPSKQLPGRLGLFSNGNSWAALLKPSGAEHARRRQHSAAAYRASCHWLSRHFCPRPVRASSAVTRYGWKPDALRRTAPCRICGVHSCPGAASHRKGLFWSKITCCRTAPECLPTVYCGISSTAAGRSGLSNSRPPRPVGKSSMVRWLAQWMRGEQCRLFTLALARLLMLSLMTYPWTN